MSLIPVVKKQNPYSSTSLFNPFKKFVDELDKQGHRVYALNYWGGMSPLFGWNPQYAWERLRNGWNDDTTFVLVGYEEEISLATALKEVTFSDDFWDYSRDNTNLAIVIEPDSIASGSRGESYFNELVAAGMPVLYDTRSPESKITSRTSGIMSFGRPRRIPSYTGELDPKFASSYAKTMMVEYASQVWKGHRIHDERGMHSALTTIKRSKNLANAMFLGHAEVTLPTGAGSGTKLSSGIRDRLVFADLNITNVTGKVAQSLDSLAKFKDVSIIWDKCLENHHLSITMSDEELADWVTCKQIFDEIAKHTGIDKVVELYFAGLPVEDLVG